MQFFKSIALKPFVNSQGRSIENKILENSFVRWIPTIPWVFHLPGNVLRFLLLHMTLLLSAGLFSQTPKITIFWATENFTTGSRVLEDEHGNPLNPGPSGNQNGAVVEIGYFVTEEGEYVSEVDFNTGKWTPLTQGTHIGDSSSGYGFGPGKFSFMTTFSQNSDIVTVYASEPKEFHETLTYPITSETPPENTQIFVRFYSSSSRLPSQRKYNTVTGENWLWPSFPSGSTLPQNLQLKISDEANVNTEWQVGNTFEANGTGQRFQAVLRETFDLNVSRSSNSPGEGSVSITTPAAFNGKYEAGEITVSAEANSSNSFFMRWEGEGVENPWSPTTTVTLNGDQSVVAHFSLNIYEVTTSIAGNGSVAINGSAVDTELFDHGDTLSLVATPDAGHVFLGWAYLNAPTIVISENPSVSYTVIEELDFVALFEPDKYELKLLSQVANTGTVRIYEESGELIEKSGDDDFYTLEHGKIYSLYAEPSPHHFLSQWSGWTDPSTSPLINPNDLSNPLPWITLTEDLNLTASFLPMNYPLKILSTSGSASISPAPGTHYLLATMLADVNASALDGYRFVNWNDPFSILLDSTNANTEANMSRAPSSGATITAVFELLEYDRSEILVNAGVGGSVNLENHLSFTHFEKYSLVATPEKGYEFVEWRGPGTYQYLTFGKNEKINELLVVGQQPSDLNITAVFATSEYFIDANVSPDGSAGEVFGKGGFTILDSLSLTAQPKPGWKFAGWTGDVDALTDLNATTTYVATTDRNFSFTANFEPVPIEVSISSDGNGAFSASYSLPTADSFIPLVSNETSLLANIAYSSSLSLDAFEDEGWQFDQWLNLPDDSLEQRTSHSLLIADLFDDASITARFEKRIFNVSTSHSSGGSTQGGGTYAYEQNVSISATPQNHFTFSGWQVSQSEDGDSFFDPSIASQIFAMPALQSSDLQLHAAFNPVTYRVSSTLEGNGIVSTVGKYEQIEISGDEHNATSEVTLTATPGGSQYLKLWRWTDPQGNERTSSSNPFVIPHLDGNYSFHAVFEAKPVDYVDYNASPYPLSGGYVEVNETFDGSERTLAAIPNQGFSFKGWTAYDENNVSIPISPHWTSRQIDLNVSNSAQITAHFSADFYNLSLDFNASQGTVSGNATSYTFGQSVELHATPSAVHSFVQWEVDQNHTDQPFAVERKTSSLYETLENRLFVNDRECPELTLLRGHTYKFDYSLTDGVELYFSTDNLGNYDSNYTDGTVHDRDTRQISFTVPASAPDLLYYHDGASPFAGNRLRIIDANLSELLPSESHASISTEIFSNLKLRALFERAPLTITKSVIGQGDIRILSGAPYYQGDQITVTAEPFPNWKFVRWENDDTVDNAYLATTSLTSSSDIELIAIFALNDFELSLPVEPASFGTARTETNERYFTPGATTQIMARANSGKSFKYWLFEDGTKKYSQDLNVTISADTTIEAVFAPQTFNVNVIRKTLDENGSLMSENLHGGTVSTLDNTENYSFQDDETAQLKYFAFPGYRFLRWQTDEANSTETNWEKTITGDLNLTAYFQRIPYSVRITSTDSSRGSILHDGSTVPELNRTMIYGETISAYAQPAVGFRFEKWLVVPDGSIANPKLAQLDLTIRQNLTISPLFVPIENLPLSIVIFPEQAGYSDGEGAFPYNENHAIYAQARKGWEFVRWDGEGIHDTESARTTILLDKEKEIKAVFKLSDASQSDNGDVDTGLNTKNILLVVTENEKSYGDAHGSGFFALDEYATVTATAATGYEFVRWEGDHVVSPYSIQSQVLVKKDATIVAHFMRQGLMDDSEKIGDGWWKSGKFGFFMRVPGTEWFFHETLGWILMRETISNQYNQTNGSLEKTSSFWVWIDRIGIWAWMNKDNYPHMYAKSESLNGWIWISSDLSKYPKIVLHSFDEPIEAERWKEF